MKHHLKSLYRFGSRRWQTLHLDYPVDLTPRFTAENGTGLEPLQRLCEDRRDTIESNVREILNYKTALHAIRTRQDETNPLKPGWNNRFLPGLDMAALFMMVAKHQPNRYVEVGSGNSTLVAAAAKSQFSAHTEIISIDPFPRADIDQISQHIIRLPFERVGSEWAESLQAGDMLFIDNSHRVLPNSDATVFFLEWLPRLKPGVIVQVHDVYLPWDYPQEMCDRGYSEQYMLAMALMSNPNRYQPTFPAYWIYHQPDLQSILAPLWEHPNTRGVEQHGGSFWFTIGA